MGTFGGFSDVKWQDLVKSFCKPILFKESFRMAVPLLHFVNFHPVDLATIFDQSLRVAGAKCAFLKNCEITNIWLDMPFPEGSANFSGPARGCSLALAALVTWREAL